MKPLGCVHQRQAIFYRAYQLARAFQQLPKALHHERMVIGQEYARPAHGVSTTRGTLTKTCVPSPERECKENVPFTCRTTLLHAHEAQAPLLSRLQNGI